MQVNMLKRYTFGNQTLIAWIHNENIWFYGNSIAKILGYKNTKDAISRHVEANDQRALSYRDSRETRLSKSMPLLWKKNDFRPKRFINRSGVYALIESSRLPEAKQFRHWLNHHVLPSIADNGFYANPQHGAKHLGRSFNVIFHELCSNMTTADAMGLFAKAFANEAKLERKEAFDHPAAVRYRSYVNNPSLMSTTVIAKDYGLSAVTLNRILHANHIIFRQGKRWVPYQDVVKHKLGGFQSYPIPNGKQLQYWKWSNKGRLFIFKLLDKLGYAPTRPIEPYPNDLMERAEKHLQVFGPAQGRQLPSRL